MDLDDRDIQEFMTMWKEEFKETLSPAEARKCASLFLELYFVLYGPHPKTPEPAHGPQYPTQ
jgi:hypothetical protein